jgi:hypothetical protein
VPPARRRRCTRLRRFAKMAPDSGSPTRARNAPQCPSSSLAWAASSPMRRASARFGAPDSWAAQSGRRRRGRRRLPAATSRLPGVSGGRYPRPSRAGCSRGHMAHGLRHVWALGMHFSCRRAHPRNDRSLRFGHALRFESFAGVDGEGDAIAAGPGHPVVERGSDRRHEGREIPRPCESGRRTPRRRCAPARKSGRQGRIRIRPAIRCVRPRESVHRPGPHRGAPQAPGRRRRRRVARCRSVWRASRMGCFRGWRSDRP